MVPARGPISARYSELTRVLLLPYLLINSLLLARLVMRFVVKLV
jgi:hypothetical protein